MLKNLFEMVIVSLYNKVQHANVAIVEINGNAPIYAAGEALGFVQRTF